MWRSLDGYEPSLFQDVSVSCSVLLRSQCRWDVQVWWRVCFLQVFGVVGLCQRDFYINRFPPDLNPDDGSDMNENRGAELISVKHIKCILLNTKWWKGGNFLTLVEEMISRNVKAPFLKITTEGQRHKELKYYTVQFAAIFPRVHCSLRGFSIINVHEICTPPGGCKPVWFSGLHPGPSLSEHSLYKMGLSSTYITLLT